MSYPGLSISRRLERDRPRLAFPPTADDDGRLLRVETEPEAVRQLLGLVRDVGPGEFPGLPELYNPCDLARGETAEEQVADLCRQLERFFIAIGLSGLEVEWERPLGRDGRELGRIVLRRNGGWSLPLRLERREGMIVYDAKGSESEVC